MWPPAAQTFRWETQERSEDEIRRSATRLRLAAEHTFTYHDTMTTIDTFDGDTDHNDTTATGTWRCNDDSITLEGTQTRAYTTYKHSQDEDTVRVAHPPRAFTRRLARGFLAPRRVAS